MAENVKILLVEDETFLRELYEELLVDEGYDVTSCVNGVEAIEAINDSTYELTLLDIMLPEKDGMTVMQELTESGEKEKLGKVVFLTNLGQDALIKKGFDLGGVGYLIKSEFTPDQILVKVEEFLNG